ncbi:hypothetical protein LCGC14_2089190, partial [marine sediment metagenome]
MWQVHNTTGFGQVATKASRDNIMYCRPSTFAQRYHMILGNVFGFLTTIGTPLTIGGFDCFPLRYCQCIRKIALSRFAPAQNYPMLLFIKPCPFLTLLDKSSAVLLVICLTIFSS